jgi:hypothetical protein
MLPLNSVQYIELAMTPFAKRGTSGAYAGSG